MSHLKPLESVLGLSLVSHSFLSSPELFLGKEVIVLKGLHILIKLEDERTCSWNVVLENLQLRQAGEVLNNSTKRVAVTDNDDALTCHNLRADCVIPVRHHTIARHLKRLPLGDYVRGQHAVAALEARVPLVSEIKLGRRDVVATTPLSYLIFAVLCRSLSLVKALERTIVTLVQAP